VLPCVDIFLVDEFFFWETILRMCLALRCGAQLADVRTCLAFALRMYVGAPNLRMCLALHWGAQLADVPCDAFGFPSCGCALRCVGVPKLGEAVLKSLPPSGCALRCVGAPNLRTCRRALRLRCGRALGAQLADVPCVTLGRPTLVRLY
jgi:hypothetical protein